MSRYNQPVGALRHVQMTHEAPPFIEANPVRRGRRALGIRYENRLHEAFGQIYPGYLPSMWFNYADSESDSKWCQTDGLIVDPWRGRIIIVEAKYQHTPTAYYQLFKLYLPVVQWLFGAQYDIICCEVVKWFDPAVLTPVRPTMCKDPANARKSHFNVHIWK